MSPFAGYEQDESDLSLEDEGKQFQTNRTDWLKMQKGQIYRGAFVHFHPVDKNAVGRALAAAKKAGTTLTEQDVRSIARKALESKAKAMVPPKDPDQLTVIERLDLTDVKLKMFSASFQTGLGFVINRLGKDGPEADAVWRKIDAPKTYFSTLLLIYPANSQGNITEKEAPRLATDCRLIPWRFSNKTREQIFKLNDGLKSNGMGLHSQDIKLECTDEKYQNIGVSFLGPALWQAKPGFRNMILGQALPLYDKLNPFNEMTTDKLRSKLGLGAPSVTVDAASGGDFADLLASV